MADTTQILGAFRTHLVAQGIVRLPVTAPTGGLAPMFVEPEDGPFSPGELKSPENDDTLVLSIFWGGAVAAGDDSFRLRGTIDVRFRSKTTAGLKRSAATARLIRAAMFEVGGPSPGIRRQGWTMGGVPMILTGEWGAYSRIGGSRDAGYDHVWKAYVEAYA